MPSPVSSKNQLQVAILPLPRRCGPGLGCVSGAQVYDTVGLTEAGSQMDRSTPTLNLLILGHRCSRGGAVCCRLFTLPFDPVLCPQDVLQECWGSRAVQKSPPEWRVGAEGKQFQGLMPHCKTSWKEEYPDPPLLLLRRAGGGGTPVRPSWESVKRGQGSPEPTLLLGRQIGRAHV